MQRTVSFICIICVLAISIVACSAFKSDEELIEDRINDFLKSYNSGDMDGVLESMDTRSRNAMEATLNMAESLGGSLLGIDGINISDLFAFSMGILSDGDVLTVKILRINIEDEENATVDVIMAYDDNFNEFSEEAFFTMVKEDDNWYIRNLQNK